MVKTLIAEQMINVDELARFWRNYKACSKANFTLGYVRGRIEELSKLWEEFRALNKQILLKQGSKAREDDYFKNEVYDKEEQEYFSRKGVMMDAIQSFMTVSATPCETSGVQQIEAKPQVPAEEPRLPRITIPKFSGKYTEWTSFHDLFVSVVHKSRIPNVQKFHFLQTSLTGEAQSLLKQFSLSEANYIPAWEYLCNRYQNKRLLINTHINIFLSQPNLSQDNAGTIRRLLDTSVEALESIAALEVDTSSWDPIIIHIMTQKLPAESHQLWEQSLGASTDLPTLDQFKKFLEARFRTLEATADKMKLNRDYRPKQTNSVQTYHNAVHCRICKNGSHSVRQCPQFLKLDVRGRLDLVKRKDCCINCLAQSHAIKDCKTAQGCFKCGKRHNTLLHFPSKSNTEEVNPSNTSNFVAQTKHTNQNPNPAAPVATTQNSSQNTSNNTPNVQAPCFEPRQPNSTSSGLQIYHTDSHRQVLLATALIYAGFAGKNILLRALIDPGSQASFVSETACQSLRLPKLTTMASVTGLGKTQTATSKSMVRFSIGSRLSNYNLDIEAITLSTLTDLLPSREVSEHLLPPLNDLKLADPNFHSPGAIDVILGADVYPHIVLEGVKWGPGGAPIAQNTHLGWVLSGSAPDARVVPPTVSVNSFYNKLDLETQLQRFWETEEVPTVSPLTAEEKMCEDMFQQTITRNEDGRFVVRLPFRPFDDRPELGDSRSAAFRRLISLKARFQRDPEFYAAYKASIEEYIALGQLQRVPNTEIKSEHAYYMPHHAVYKETGAKKKLRVVFDASAKGSNGKSLNNVLLVGPALQPSIVDVVLRFRRHAIAFTADIEKMYPQIMLHPDDADYQRILWMDSLSGPVYDLKFPVVVFGVSSSPYLAIRTLRKLAEDEREKFPIAAEIVEKDSYVDDMLTGGDTIEAAIEAQTQLTQMLASAGFKLKKWASNNEELLRGIPVTDRLMDVPVQMNMDNTIKTLGIVWNPTKDEFSFKVSVPSTMTLTKRTVLSTTAKLYDPLGWVAPAVIIAKVFMQTLWLAGLSWDDELPSQLRLQWIAFANTLQALETVRIPRFVDYANSSSIEIHGFSDASEKSYAAVVYIRTLTTENNIKVHMLAAKTRVAPVQAISVPRLELCGAVLLTKLLVEVKRAMNLENSPTFAWTDSSIVLTWLHGHPNKWKCFVGNRVTKIVQQVPPSNWKHVSSQDNPADLATRGVPPTQLASCTQWWYGPSWLSIPETEWPISKVNTSDTQPLEARKVHALVNVQQKEDFRSDFLTRFSSLPKLLSATAYWRRFIYNCRSSMMKRLRADESDATPLRSGPLTPAEFSTALDFWILSVQHLEFPEDVANLKLKRGISTNKRLASLVPFLDKNGIMRLGGRLEQANLSFEQKHPSILPHSSHLTTLIIQDQHANTLHGGVQLTLNMLRKKYWILKARSAVKSCIHRCIKCFRQKGQTSTQLMANLPTTRVTISRPFMNTGVDYAGPLVVRMSKGRGCRTYKGYIAIFVCFATRAIHLEVVSDLTTDAFLAALKRFIARRGLCANMYSDCGTNFVGAKSTLEKEYSAAIDANNTLATTLAKDGINWHLNPPGAPHFGGLWEAGVKSMKHHLRRVMGNATLTYEELSTLVTQIEACLNSRPLCPLSDDPSDVNALTPGHFLIGEALLAPPEHALENANTSTLRRWQLLQHLRHGFWRQWGSEYLSRLQQRPKWLTPKENFNVGDLVLVKEENFAPLKWPLGRITELHPGKDGLVRVVTIKTQHGIVKRPIAKVCVLPLESSTPQTLSNLPAAQTA